MLAATLVYTFAAVGIVLVASASVLLARTNAFLFAELPLKLRLTLSRSHFGRVPKPLKRKLLAEPLFIFSLAVLLGSLTIAFLADLVFKARWYAILACVVLYILSMTAAIRLAWVNNIRYFRRWDDLRVRWTGRHHAHMRQSISHHLANSFFLDVYTFLVMQLSPAAICAVLFAQHGDKLDSDQQPQFDVPLSFIISGCLAFVMTGTALRWIRRRVPAYSALQALDRARVSVANWDSPTRDTARTIVRAGLEVNRYAESIERDLPYPLTSGRAALLRASAANIQEFIGHRDSLTSDRPRRLINAVCYAAIIILDYPPKEFYETAAADLNAFNDEGNAAYQRDRTPIGRVRGFLSNSFNNFETSVASLLKLAQVAAMGLLIWLWWRGDLDLVELAKQLFQ
ncbi:hypothetical protein C8E86_3203 [Catellatospora citrea]|nr:hypothetical protein C8E86_3203 [Catellatospora citrea]